MKKLFFFLQGSAFVATNFFLLLAVYQLLQSPSRMNRPGYEVPTYNRVEDFDPSLSRLDDVPKLLAFCDSVYAKTEAANSLLDYKSAYPEMAVNVVRKRFYHGYSLYSFSNNYMAMLVSKLGKDGLSAIVVPNDILKYPYAACSQQSIVLMEILHRKGFDTRSVAFQGKKGGHFCFEVFYKGCWHFYDPDMEPNGNVLDAYGRPDAGWLAAHPDVMLSAYKQYPPSMMLDFFSYFKYGKVNAAAAPRAYLFQQVAKLLSYTIWTFFLVLFILLRRKYLSLRRPHVRNSRVQIPELQPGSAPLYHFEY